MTRSVVVGVLVWLCACGESPVLDAEAADAAANDASLFDAQQCSASGSGIVDGSVSSRSFGEVKAAVVTDDSAAGWIVGLYSEAGECPQSNMSGNRLVVFMCEPSTGTSVIGTDCAGDNGARAMVFWADTADFEAAWSGTITINSAFDQPCVDGSFEVVFGGGTLTGTFNARNCMVPR